MASASAVALILAVAFTIAAGGLSVARAACPAPTGPYSEVAGVGGDAVSDDPLSGAQWGLRQIRAPGAWAAGARGSGVTIAVVDTGVDRHHPDLQSALTDGVDVLGAEKGGCDDGSQDHSGHGTLMAGVAAARADNRIGIAGVAPLATVLPIRVGTTSATVEDLAEGITAAVARGADVINVSFSDYPVLGEARAAETFRPVLEDAWRRGSLVVSSAGNFAAPLCSQPSSGPHVVCVGATDVTEAPSSYSNVPLRSSDDGLSLRAPGGEPDCTKEGTVQGVWSTLSLDHYYGTGCRIAGYTATSGTSPAAAAVSGVAALLAGRGLSNAEILDCLARTGRQPLTGQRGVDNPTYGAGIVDAEAAVQACTAPASPLPASEPTGAGGAGGGSGADPSGAASSGPAPPAADAAPTGSGSQPSRLWSLSARLVRRDGRYLVRVRIVAPGPAATRRLVVDLRRGPRRIGRRSVRLRGRADLRFRLPRNASRRQARRLRITTRESESGHIVSRRIR